MTVIQQIPGKVKKYLDAIAFTSFALLLMIAAFLLVIGSNELSNHLGEYAFLTLLAIVIVQTVRLMIQQNGPPKNSVKKENRNSCS